MSEQRTGNEAEETNMRSAIIFGLGGTGLEVMMMVRRMIIERYGALEELPIISFLHIDTANEKANLTPSLILGQNISLSKNERVTLGMPKIEDGGASYLSQHSMVKEWFPPNLRIEHDFTLGAGAVRAFGRLAFSENAQSIELALRNCAERVNADVTRRYVAQKWAPVDTGLDVYIVCSLLGGTGSGTFLDAAYLARRVIQSFSSNNQVIGFLIVGGGSSIESPNLANCYGALKELVYFSTEAQKSNETRRSAFSVQYPKIPIRLESEAYQPFNFCYLATNFNEMDVQLKKEELFELTAQNIFLEFTPGVAATKRAIRNNIAQDDFKKLDQRMNQAQSFLSFGISTIEFPALRVQDCLAYRLAGEAMSYWRFAQAPSDASIPQQVKKDLHEWGLNTEHLVKALITDDSGNTLIKMIADLKNARLHELQKYIPRSLREELIVHLRNFLEGARQDVNVTVDPATRGSHVKQIDIRSQKLLNAAVSGLRQKVAEKISSPYGGAQQAITYLQSLKENLLTYAQGYKTASEMQMRKVPAAADKETRAFARAGSGKLEAKDAEMRVLVSDVLKASLEYSEATVFEYANRTARLLLAGERDNQGRWSCDCLIKEIERLEGQIDAFTRKLDEMSREYVGTKERDESGRETWNGGKFKELFNNLTSGAFNSDLLVEAKEIDSLYEARIKNASEEYIRLKVEIERGVGAEDSPVSILWCVLENPEQVKRVAFEASRKRFFEVREISIAKKLSALAQAEVDRKIEDAFNRSHVLLRFDNNNLFAADPETGNRLTHHNPGYHSTRLVATCQIQNDPDVDLTPEKPEHYSRLANAFRMKVTDTQQVMNLPDRYRLVFVQEKGVFPLYSIADFKQLHDAYIYETRRQNPKPCETNYSIAFPDLFPRHPRELEIPAIVERALRLGCIFNLIIEAKNVITEEPEILYVYKDEHLTRREINLGRTFDEALQTMSDRQIDKEIYFQRRDEITPFEMLEKSLLQEGERPRTVTEKEQAWTRLQTYLNNLAGKLAEGDRNPAYAKERDIVNSFRNRFQWLPPKDSPEALSLNP